MIANYLQVNGRDATKYTVYLISDLSNYKMDNDGLNGSPFRGLLPASKLQES